MEAEQASFTQRQLIDPGCISRTPQCVLDDATSVWQLMDHCKGVRGHMYNALSISLHGDEDKWISRAAKDLGDDPATDMINERRKKQLRR